MSPGDRGSTGAPHAGSRGGFFDRLLLILVVLIALSVVSLLVGGHYYTELGANECYPDCTFNQDLAGGASFFGKAGVVVFAFAGVVRLVLLWRRRF